MDENEDQNVVYLADCYDLCRLCLRNDHALQNLFCVENLLEHVQEATGLEFDINDPLPNSVCTICVDKVNSFVEFRGRCRTTDQWLRNVAADSDAEYKGSKSIDLEIMSPKDMLIEPDQFEEQLIDDPASISDTIENEIELADCIVQTEEVLSAETLNTNSGVHKCTICNKELYSAYTLANHMRSHTGERPFGCKVCEKFFKTKSNLNEHYRVHDPRLRWMKTSSKDLPSLTRVTITSDGALTCNHCERSFASLDELSAHEQELLRDATRRTACEKCGRTFDSETQLSAHVATCNCVLEIELVQATGGGGGRLCPYCGKSFRTTATLENHKRVHTREKPFECEQCQKRFRTKGNLLEHKRVHNANLWLMKSNTKLALDAAASLGAGDAKNGSGPEAERFRCTFCAKPFRTHAALLNHERVHTRDKPFECSVCGKCFRTKSNLTEHTKGCHDAYTPAASCHADEVQVFTFRSTQQQQRNGPSTSQNRS